MGTLSEDTNALRQTATHCNTLQHIATHRNILQHTVNTLHHHHLTSERVIRRLQHTATYCDILQHTATHCNTLQHTATHCNTLQRTATHRWACYQRILRQCSTTSLLTPLTRYVKHGDTHTHTCCVYHCTHMSTLNGCACVCVCVCVCVRTCARRSQTLQHTVAHCNMKPNSRERITTTVCL